MRSRVVGLYSVVILSALLACFFGCSAGEKDATDPSKRSDLNLSLLRRLEGHQEYILSLDFSPDGKLLASTSYDGTLRLWDVAEGKEVHKMALVRPDDKGQFNGSRAVFSPDGKTVAALVHTWPPAEWTIRFWDGKTGKEQPRKISARPIYDMAFSPDGTKLAVAGHWVQVWDLTKMQILLELNPEKDTQGRAHRVSFSPDGKFVAAALNVRDEGARYGHFDNVRVWDAVTGKQVMGAWKEGKDMQALSFSPDGQYLAIGGREGAGRKVLRVWDMKERRLVKNVELGKLELWALRFANDSRVLLGCGTDSSIHLWDVKGGLPMAPLKIPAERVDTLAISRDEWLLATPGTDESSKPKKDTHILLWQIQRR